jgi:Reactive mitochondrial oxygen species modulator 1
MWFKKNDSVDSKDNNFPASFEPLAPVKTSNSAVGGDEKIKKFTGFSAPPQTTLESVKLDYKPKSSGDGLHDPYAKEMSTLEDGVADSPSVRMSKVDYLLSGSWIENPRARACYNNVKLGVKMGGLVGGIFGGLAGTVYAVQSRQIMALPATMIICGGSFGFFLGCGMIIRCETGLHEFSRI